MQAAALPWLFMGLATVGAGVAAYSSYATGVMQQAAYDAEARQRTLESKQADLQAKQISALRLSELNANLAAISAARAGKNLAGDSPTEVALVRSFTRESLGARSSEVLDARLRKLSLLNAAYSARVAGKSARLAGTLGAIGHLTDGAIRVAQLKPSKKEGGE